MNEAAPPPPKTPEGQPENWAQLKAKIDSGSSGDKVGVGDPAAAPLGTDAEAGGDSTSSEQMRMNAAAETSPAAQETKSAELAHNVGVKPGGGMGLIIGIVAALVLVAILAWLLLRH
jgi:hypothetical protein